MSIPYTRKIAETDVRINNVILYKGTPTRVQIFHLQEMRAFSLDCEPVELTTEMLENAGFKVGEWENSYRHPLWILDLNVTAEGFELAINDEAGYPIARVKYLHQLQNLFYFIVGEELEVQL